jgi:hypothetical protein
MQTDQLYVKDVTLINNIDSTDSTIIADEYATLSKLFVLAEKLFERPGERSRSDCHIRPLHRTLLRRRGLLSGHRHRPDHPRRHTGAFVVEKSEAIPKDFLHDLALSLLVNRPLMKDYERRAQDLSRLGKQNESMRQELASLRQAQRAQNVQSSSFSPVRSHHQSIYNSIRPRHGLRMIDRTWLVTRIFSW